MVKRLHLSVNGHYINALLLQRDATTFSRPVSSLRA